MPMTVTDIIEAIHAEIHRAGSMTALAREWGVSKYLISKVVGRKQGPGPGVLRPLGIECVKTVEYRREVPT